MLNLSQKLKRLRILPKKILKNGDAILPNRTGLDGEDEEQAVPIPTLPADTITVAVEQTRDQNTRSVDESESEEGFQGTKPTPTEGDFKGKTPWRGSDTRADNSQWVPGNHGNQAIQNHEFHDFIMYNPVFMEAPGSTVKAMKLLSRKAIFSASLDSSARYPPPTCLEGTREDVRSRILTWVTDKNRVTNFLWLYGPAGAGTSAVAQTIAEYCEDQGWLGAAFFFPRKYAQEDHTRVIPSLAYQLATVSPAYRNMVTSLLDHDRSILDHALHSQFQKLIVRPLTSVNFAAVTGPVLILLDGLSNCRDDAFQRELIEHIGRFAATAKRNRLPFVWIISSRQDWQLFSTFLTADPPILCQTVELSINTHDAKEDVSKYIRHGFQKILQAHPYATAEENVWPAEDQLSLINSLASGLFAFASAVLDFVDSDNPVAKFHDSLNYLRDGIIPKSGNPLQSLHSLYRDILEIVPPDVFPLTKRVLSFLILGAREIPAQVVAEFLSLDQSAFFGSLRCLHSVLNVPAPEYAHRFPLLILHASMEEFLKDMIESGDFDLDVRATTSDVVASIENRCLELYVTWKTKGLDGMLPSDRDHTEFGHSIIKFLMHELWTIWSHKNEEDIPALHENLTHFDFSEYGHDNGRLEALAPMKDVRRQITQFLCLLSSWQDKNESPGYPILRSKPECPTDHQLFKRYSDLINHPRMEKFDSHRLEVASERWLYKGFSVATEQSTSPNYSKMSEGFSNSQLMYFLLGHDANTCLVVAYQ